MEDNERREEQCGSSLQISPIHRATSISNSMFTGTQGEVATPLTEQHLKAEKKPWQTLLQPFISQNFWRPEV